MVAERNQSECNLAAADQAALLEELTALRQQVTVLRRQVSRLTQAERSKQMALEAAASAERIKDEFLAILSHELRSPLNPILGWTRLLRSHQFDPQMTHRALDAIERNAKLQVQLIEDLLDVSQILQGKLQLNIGQVNLVTVVEAALKTTQLAAQSKQITLTPIVTSGSTWVAGDAARLQQIVWNLISNAVKFTPVGGQVQIELEQIPHSQLAQLRVSDSGQGIAPEFLPYMFDYFRQADSTITRQFGGLGLGLTIVRHLVELHGGQIQVESAGIGQGAMFSVTLPMLSAGQPESKLHSTVPLTVPLNLTRSIERLRVLLVEQNADLREYLTLVLQTSGARVALASSAGEALAKLPRAQPEILICELGLPSVDGCSLLRQIRSLVPELGGRVPALALMSYAGEYSHQEILDAGFQQHLSMPVEPDALVEAVHRLVHQSGNPVASRQR